MAVPHTTVLGITGSTGHVGGLVARRLATRPLRGATVRLIARDAARAPRLGFETRAASYGDPDAAATALEGVDVLFMVSGGENEHRRHEHRSFIEAARRAGVGQLIYTSFLGADPRATFTLGRDHADTEAAIRESGIPATILRDNFYSDLLPYFAGEDGAIRGPAGSGRVSAVARADVADVALAALADPDGHAGAVYDLTGPEALTLGEVAARGGAAIGRTLSYEQETVDEAYASRRKWSEEQWQLDAWVSTYLSIAEGRVERVSGDVERLTGHPARTIEEALASQG